MRKLVIRTSASADLKGIAAWTRKQWGEEQARRYVALLRKQIKSLANFPERFASSQAGHAGLRKMSTGRHVVFYLMTDKTVEVVRILHDAMDFDERLR